MSKGSKLFVAFLFILTAGLAGAAIWVSNQLKESPQITPDQNQAAEQKCTEPPNKGNLPDTCLQFLCPNGCGGDGQCRTDNDPGASFSTGSCESLSLGGQCGQIDMVYGGTYCGFKEINCGPQCAGPITNPPTPTPTLLATPSPVAVGGTVYCQDTGGTQYPVQGATVYIHDSFLAFNNGQCKDAPCEWTLTTDAQGKYSATIPFKNDGTKYTNGIDARLQTLLQGGKLSNGQLFTAMKPASGSPVTGNSFALNCSNASNTGCSATGEMCQNKSFGNTSGSYSFCGLTPARNIMNVDFKFTSCGATVCGNGTCNTGESCDGSSQCLGNGRLSSGECRADCTYCGDGIKQVNEDCDDGNTNDNDSCDNSCLYRAVNPPTATPTATPLPTITNPPTAAPPADCGNNACNVGEYCDRDQKCSGGGLFDKGECRADCTYCGDGVPQAGELCDDGNTNHYDSCSNFCRPNGPLCGDGLIQPGEECDPNLSQSCGPGAACSLTCKCIPNQSGMCGSSCSNDGGCPSDNVCVAGICKLAICQTFSGKLLSSPLSAGIGPSFVCASNGCSLVECGSTCGSNRVCPAGLSCNSANVCVLPYCAKNKCTDACLLPPTALEDKALRLIMLALVLIMLGIAIQKSTLREMLNYGFTNVIENKKIKLLTRATGLSWLSDRVDSLYRLVLRQVNLEKLKKDFEQDMIKAKFEKKSKHKNKSD